MESSGAKAAWDAKERTLRQIRKKTLFGPFLEDGIRGYKFAACFACESLGLLLSPILFPLQGLEYAFSYASDWAWNKIMYYSALNIYEQQKPNPLTSLLVWLSKIVVESQDDNSEFNRIMNVLDYNRIGFIARFRDQLLDELSIPLWFIRVTWRAPRMYIDYFLFDKGSLLPPRRPCCFLRNGLKHAEEELKEVEKKIKKETDIRDLIEIEKNEKFALNDNKDVINTNLGSKVDFGPDGAFESLLNKCVSKIVRGYNYSICFFGEIHQNQQISLGTFRSWGSKFQTGEFSTVDSNAANEMSRIQHIPENQKSLYHLYKQAPLFNIPQSLSNLLPKRFFQFSTKPSKLLSKEEIGEMYQNHYSYQMYTEGSPCEVRKGVLRSTLVKFECNLKTEIQSVIEVEVRTK